MLAGVTDSDPNLQHVALSHLPPGEKAKYAGSFGGVASLYERYRPGPPVEAIGWLLPQRVGTVVDLGAGTGALTRLLVDRADEVVAVEPDDRMRAVLAGEVPAARAVAGRGEAIPVPDGSADAVLASSSWHWMDPVATLGEVARVLVPGGTLGVLWSGPDPDSPFIAQARALVAPRAGDAPVAANDELSGAIQGTADRPASTLEIPKGIPFEEPEHAVFRRDVALDADELIGLLGTFSAVITLPAERRQTLLDEARRLLREVLGVEGDVTVDVGFRCDAWRSRPVASG
jgi:SAM-dependent methyltransferase